MGLKSAKSYDDILADCLERLLAMKLTELHEFVDGLNRANVRGPNGEVWTEALLERELERLGR